ITGTCAPGPSAKARWISVLLSGCFRVLTARFPALLVLRTAPDQGRACTRFPVLALDHGSEREGRLTEMTGRWLGVRRISQVIALPPCWAWKRIFLRPLFRERSA